VVGEVIAGRYELEEVIGGGGMSSVFKARDRLLERHVALKVLHDEYAEDDEQVTRFRREARAVAQLSHPNIVTVIDRGVDGGRQFIVFEYIEGENLKQLLERTGRLPLRRAVELAAAAADGLAFAHEQGIVHRDVKPQNVLLSNEGEVRVTDFGIARSLDVEHELTEAGTVLGTSTYISPEQATGQQATPATDVYSLGVVLYELVTGEVPFSGETFVAVALRHAHEAPRDVAELRQDVSPRLAAATRCALEKDPRRRFPSMHAFASELHGCLAELAEPDLAPTLVGLPAVRVAAAAPRRRRRAWAISAAGLVLAVGAVAAGVLVLGRPQTTTPAPPGTTAARGGSTATVTAVTSYDPRSDGGDGSEHNTGLHSVADATDGSAATYWTTDIYKTRSFGGLKPGVGLVLDAGSSVALKRLIVTTDTPGFTAKILAGDSPTGPFGDDSTTETVGRSTSFALTGASGRYYVLWITLLPPGRTAHVNEVSAG